MTTPLRRSSPHNPELIAAMVTLGAGKNLILLENHARNLDSQVKGLEAEKKTLVDELEKARESSKDKICNDENEAA